ncbi:MAG: sigma 54-interacting transcriptional regulator [candidate division Zixibacteria bacterium]
MGNKKTILKSNRYTLVEPISQNNISQSWVALDKGALKKRFLKIPSDDNSVDLATKINILRRSLELQKKLHSRKILTHIGQYSSRNNFAIIYPFLEKPMWGSLTPKLFFRHFPDTIMQIFQIVDYLHLLNIIHCDLKLENFMIKEEKGKITICLIDLDYLVESGSRPDSKIFGTPGHIAPEIFRNSVVTLHTDNYSVGVLIKKCLDWGEISGVLTRIPRDNLYSMADALTVHDSFRRPDSLMDCLKKYNIFKDIECHEKTLLEMQLTSSFLSKRNEIRSKNNGITEFINDNNLLGINEEIINDLCALARGNFKSVFSISKYFIRNCNVRRSIKYWHLDWDHSHIYRLFQQLNVDNTGEYFDLDAFPITPARFTDFITTAKEYETLNKPYKAYLLFLLIKQNSNKIPADASEPLLKETNCYLLRLSRKLHKFDDVIEYGEEILANTSRISADLLSIVKILAHTYLFRGEMEKANEKINLGHSLCEIDSTDDLELRCHRSWILMLRGEYKSAIETLINISDICKKNEETKVWLKAQSYIAAVYWYQGNFNDAYNIYTESIPIAKANKEFLESRNLINNYSRLLFDLAEYEKCIKNAKDSQRIKGELGFYGEYTDQFRIIALSYARLGQYDKSLTSHTKYLLHSPDNSQNTFLGLYFYQRGFIDTVQNKFDTAKRYLFNSKELLTESNSQSSISRIYQNFMDIAFHEGDLKGFETHWSTFQETLADKTNNACLTEIKLIKTLLDICYLTGDVNELPCCLNELAKHNCRYYSAICLFYILLNEEKINEPLPEVDVKGYWSFLANSDTPLFKAILTMLRMKIKPTEDFSSKVRIYKNVYELFTKYNFLFWAALICEKISGIYINNGFKRPAYKFIEQAIELMDSINNMYYCERYNSIKNQISAPHEYESDRIQTFYKVSCMLQNINNYEDSLEQIIQFAILETGAERGALLFHSKKSDKLQIKAYVNCDDESIKDIERLSQNIPRASMTQNASMLISNAQKDTRTKQFKSVFVHNIKSVICVPISDGKDSIGVLYLDHHTLPALFEESDLRFVEAMSNFMAVALKTLQSFRTLNLKSTEQQSELLKCGKSNQFITQCENMQKMIDKLPEIAYTNANVLFIGESGTGKEILANMIHELSHRSDKQLVKLNCASIPDSMIEGELFGIAKGVATGVEKRIGKFQAADGGTLFMDEIADMPLNIQAKVLRVLEYQKFEMVGSVRTISTDIRFIYATNKNLDELVKKDCFRKDLFHRINTITIEISPLRERVCDIPLLVEHFTGVYSRDETSKPIIPDDIMQMLMLYSWPGNVRELKNLIERWCILKPSKLLKLSDLPVNFIEDISSHKDSSSEEFEKNRIYNLLRKNNWNQSKTAQIMQIPLSTFRRKIRKYNISKDIIN